MNGTKPNREQPPGLLTGLLTRKDRIVTKAKKVNDYWQGQQDSNPRPSVLETGPFCRDFNGMGMASYQNIAKTGGEPVNSGDRG